MLKYLAQKIINQSGRNRVTFKSFYRFKCSFNFLQQTIKQCRLIKRKGENFAGYDEICF